MPSIFSIRKCATKLENHAKDLGSGFIVNNELGYGRLKFKCNHMLNFMLKTHKLNKTDETSEVEICAALDGVKFTNHMAYATCGMKAIDMHDLDPKTNNLLLNF